jgi:hypothetical protein
VTIMKEPYLPPSPHPQFNGTTIEAGNGTLLRQAPMTANEYLLSAIDHVDLKLGTGYAAKHPELIAAFMQASAIDLGTAVIARAIESLSNSLAAAITRTGEHCAPIIHCKAKLLKASVIAFTRSPTRLVNTTWRQNDSQQ